MTASNTQYSSQLTMLKNKPCSSHLHRASPGFERPPPALRFASPEAVDTVGWPSGGHGGPTVGLPPGAVRKAWDDSDL